jgi:hypothetical protein
VIDQATPSQYAAVSYHENSKRQALHRLTPWLGTEHNFEKGLLFEIIKDQSNLSINDATPNIASNNSMNIGSDHPAWHFQALLS